MRTPAEERRVERSALVVEARRERRPHPVAPRHVDVIGVPMDLGSGRRGVDMGPSAIRYAGLNDGIRGIGHVVHDLGDIDVPISEEVDEGSPRLRYLEPIVATLQALADMTAASVEAGRFPLVLGGDHSVTLGSIAGAASRRKLGVIHIDSHPDFNTDETTPSGNIHGMPMAALCGLGAEPLVTLGGLYPRRRHVDPDNLVVVAARDIDAGERGNLRAAGAHVFSMETIDRTGFESVMDEAIWLAGAGTEGIYVSFDLDAVDPSLAPGVGTPVKGGLTYRETNLAMEMLADTGKVLGCDFVECNPILDVRNQSGELSVVLALSVLGKRIW
jgi:arginase